LINLLLIMSLLESTSTNAQPNLLRYRQLPDLPGVDGKPNPGVAGAFAGTSHGALLVAGGANFPNGYPWQNGSKVWQSTIYVLEGRGELMRWQRVNHLEKPLAYGASVVWKDRLIGLGGNDANRRYADVFTLTWDTATRQLRTEPLPPLPQPLDNLSAAILGDELYVFGGESDQGPVKSLYMLNLLNPKSGWQSLADLPGPARAFTALVALSGAESSGLFVLGGRQTIDKQTTVLNDAYQYDPKRDRWVRLPDLPVGVAAHAALDLGTNRLVLFGGDDGVRLRQIEALNNQIARQPDSAEKATWIAQRNELQTNHPGFRREIWQFRTDTRRWSILGRMPFPAPVTTTAVRWDNAFVLPSGEVSPGIRTPAVRLITITNP
jgi:cyclically-permuted mutarotase family protein